MEELHIIVHEESVRDGLEKGSIDASRVLEEIRRIKSNKNYLEIMAEESPNSLHPFMPEASDNLVVFVSGAYKELCCTAQLYLLKTRGYNARFNHDAVYSGMKGAIPPFYGSVLELFPNFYD